jgi:hypothetical protein
MAVDDLLMDVMGSKTIAVEEALVDVGVTFLLDFGSIDECDVIKLEGRWAGLHVRKGGVFEAGVVLGESTAVPEGKCEELGADTELIDDATTPEVVCTEPGIVNALFDDCGAGELEEAMSAVV